jgi:hypothetical protein
MGALSLAEAAGPGPGQAWRGHDDDRRLAVEHGEFTSFCHARLVDVSGEDQLGARVRQLLEHVAAACQRPLARAPGRIGELVVKADNAQGVRRCRSQLDARSVEPTSTQSSGLVSPRPHGVDTHDMEAVCRVHGLCRLPLPFELSPRPGETARGQ